ncbi:CocE/NonD family hydrolase [Nocardioides sp. NPDC006273]|uniref:CocE/NonD family hydrolase n=1 Tax=Nocardioides sp. NPDC006273 TaxID=3155598 RepID=UPI0033BEEFB3
MSTAYERIGPAPVDESALHHLVRMRDGARLATDVYLSGKEPAATVLVRLPYDKAGEYAFLPLVAHYFVRHGYHVVTQDVRGKFRSEGETLLFVNEAADGADTLDWVIEQPWSNGIVGMWGDSYYGYTQWAAASTSHPALRALCPRVTGTRLGELPHDSDVMPGTWTREVEMGVHRLYPCTFFHSNDVYLWEPDWTRRPLVAEVEDFFTTVGSRSISFDQWFPEQVRLRRFPFGHPFEARPLPVLQTIGWWDNCAPWQWSDHWRLAEHQAWAHNEYLLIDAIDHENNHLLDPRGGRSADQVRAGLSAYLDPAIEFFDVFLRDLRPATSIPKVRWNLAHTEGFRTTTEWPPEGVTPVALHLRADLSLDPEAPEAEQTLAWIHDPDNLVPSPVEDAFGFLAEYPDERAGTEREDVLAFDGTAVNADTDLVGGVGLVATVGSDGPRMDVFVRLLDVAPDGAAHLVTRGQVHVVDCAEPRRVTIDLGQVGYRLRSGHRLRVQVSSSDYPEYIPQPGTGEHPWLAEKVVPNHQTLTVGGTEPAVLTIHVLPEQTSCPAG